MPIFFHRGISEYYTLLAPWKLRSWKRGICLSEFWFLQRRYHESFGMHKMRKLWSIQEVIEAWFSRSSKNVGFRGLWAVSLKFLVVVFFLKNENVRVGKVSRKFLELVFLKDFGMCKKLSKFWVYFVSHTSKNVVGDLLVIIRNFGSLRKVITVIPDTREARGFSWKNVLIRRWEKRSRKAKTK